eukprot:jgi/Psemu1/314189/fgenesh1_kg.1445_\
MPEISQSIESLNEIYNAQTWRRRSIPLLKRRIFGLKPIKRFDSEKMVIYSNRQ